ncbi:antigen 34 kDa [Alloactinosynnema sp. L-07]|uniref:DUF5336 domain-containing protein n=1 Tax=Alloactinosynnema sp. L-07 TaxID=1653480 RepID=UPI00065EFAB0|nr:DUF5336 domain-containing protein [Alloactinosynnema sp. L-07]CRK59906.1 antigen 34 kDa [Alloactinosynnema sp. L-07]
MTYPGGAPGGYPGPQGHGYAPGPARPKLELAQILHLVVAGLGLLNLFLGFAPIAAETGFYESPYGWIPALLFVGGVLALPVILPGDKKVGLASAAVTLGVTLAFMFTVFASDGSLKAGGIMVLIFGILQSAAAVLALLFEAGVIKPPQPQPQQPQYGQPGGYAPPSGQFQAQQPQQPQPFAQPQQPYAPPPGQFGQAPGTPPGGYPQQG